MHTFCKSLDAVTSCLTEPLRREAVCFLRSHLQTVSTFLFPTHRKTSVFYGRFLPWFRLVVQSRLVVRTLAGVSGLSVPWSLSSRGRFSWRSSPPPVTPPKLPPPFSNKPKRSSPRDDLEIPPSRSPLKGRCGCVLEVTLTLLLLILALSTRSRSPRSLSRSFLTTCPFVIGWCWLSLWPSPWPWPCKVTRDSSVLGVLLKLESDSLSDFRNTLIFLACRTGV